MTELFIVKAMPVTGSIVTKLQEPQPSEWLFKFQPPILRGKIPCTKWEIG